jgi:hypothetical protein
MLPSFRLIAATFLCGFAVVFAGLRMAVSLNDIHEGLPVMAAHAAPVSAAPPADSEARRGVAAVPVMYDLRFAVSTVSPTLVRIAPTMFDTPAPLLSVMPTQDLPSQDLPKQELAEPAKESTEPERTVAAVQPDAPAPLDVAPDATPPSTEPAKPSAQAVAAVTPQATPEPEASTAEPLLPEPDTTASVDKPDQNVDPVPVAPMPAAAVQAPAAKKVAAKPAPKAAAKVARKKPIRTAHRAAAANNPFGTPQ